MNCVKYTVGLLAARWHLSLKHNYMLLSDASHYNLLCRLSRDNSLQKPQKKVFRFQNNDMRLRSGLKSFGVFFLDSISQYASALLNTSRAALLRERPAVHQMKDFSLIS